MVRETGADRLGAPQKKRSIRGLTVVSAQNFNKGNLLFDGLRPSAKKIIPASNQARITIASPDGSRDGFLFHAEVIAALVLEVSSHEQTRKGNGDQA